MYLRPPETLQLSDAFFLASGTETQVSPFLLSYVKALLETA